MKNRIIKQITKNLNITEEYLAGYIGIPLDALNKFKTTKGWEGKAQRLYNLNTIICVLRNSGIKKPAELKNVIDNERIQLSGQDEDFSYLTVVNTSFGLSELIEHLVLKLKVNYALSKLDVTKSLFAGLLDSPEKTLLNKKTRINSLYSFIKNVEKTDNPIYLSILSEPFVCLENRTPLGLILEDKYISAEKTKEICKDFYKIVSYKVESK